MEGAVHLISFFGSQNDLKIGVQSQSGGNITTLDLTSAGTEATIGNNSIFIGLPNATTSINAFGNLSFATPTVWGNPLTTTVTATGTTFVAANDTLKFGAGVVTDETVTGGVLKLQLDSTVPGDAQFLTWDTSTSQVMYNITGPNGQTFQTSLGWVDPGYTFYGSGSTYGLQNSSGQTLDSLSVQNNGDVALNNYSQNGGPVVDTIDTYSQIGNLLSIAWENASNQIATNYLSPTNSNQVDAYGYQNSDGSSSLNGNGQNVSFAAGITPNVTTDAAGDVFAAVTTTSGTQETLELTKGGIDATVGGANYIVSGQDISAALAPFGNMWFGTPVPGGGTDAVLIAANGQSAQIQASNGTYLNLPTAATQSVSSINVSSSAIMDTIVNADGSRVQYQASLDGQTSTINSANAAGNLTQVVNSNSFGTTVDNLNPATGGITQEITTINGAGSYVINVDPSTGVKTVLVFDGPGGTGNLTRTGTIAADGSYSYSDIDPLTKQVTYTANYSNQNVLISESFPSQDTFSQFAAAIQSDFLQIATAAQTDFTKITQIPQSTAEFAIASSLLTSLTANALANQPVASLAAQAIESATLTNVLDVPSTPLSLDGVTPLEGTYAFGANAVSDFAALGAEFGASKVGTLLDNALKIPVPAGQITLSAAAGAGVQYLVATELATSSAAQSASFLTSFEGGIGGGIGSFTGNEFLSLAGINSTNAQLGGSAAAAVATTIALLSGVTGFLPLLAIGFGSDVLGGLIGNIFGGHPSVGPNATAWEQLVSGHYQLTQSGADNGGNLAFAQDMAISASSTINSINISIGGTIINAASLPTWGYGYFKGNIFATNETTDPNGYSTNTYPTTTAAISAGDFSLLKDEQIQGGNAFMTTALQVSSATNLQGLISDLNAASVYGQFGGLEQFDLFIAMSGAANYQSLMAIRAQVVAMGLNQFTPDGNGNLVYTGTVANVNAIQPALENLVASGTVSSIQLTTNQGTITLDKAVLTGGLNVALTIVGGNDQITVGSGSTVTINQGNINTVNAVAGDTVNFGAANTSNTVNGSGVNIHLNASGTVAASNDTIYTANGVTVTIPGTNNLIYAGTGATINAGSGDTVILANTNMTDTVNGSGVTIQLQNSGDSIITSGNIVDVAANVSATVTGNTAIAGNSGSNIRIISTGASNANDTVNMSGGTVSIASSSSTNIFNLPVIAADPSLIVNGTGNVVYAGQNGTITANGANNVLDFANMASGTTINMSGTATKTFTGIKILGILYSSPGLPTATYTEHFSGFQSVIGASNDTIIASATGQTLTGGGSNVTFQGYSGGYDQFKDTAANLSTATITNFQPTDTISVTNVNYVAGQTRVTLASTGAHSGILDLWQGSTLVSKISFQGNSIGFTAEQGTGNTTLIVDPSITTPATPANDLTLTPVSGMLSAAAAQVTAHDSGETDFHAFMRAQMASGDLDLHRNIVGSLLTAQAPGALPSPTTTGIPDEPHLPGMMAAWNTHQSYGGGFAASFQTHNQHGLS